ncbi:MAG: nodulation efficiency protein D (NfeD) [Bacteroidales bacterium]|nr:nodulation efficiency protein D (NfeD) [Bacteroidales bacterium]
MGIGIVVLLVVLATVLMLVEVVFIPGFGITGIAGALAMIGSVFYAFFEVSNLAGWVTLVVVGMICIALFMWALYGKSLDKVALKKKIDSKVDVVDVKRFSVGDRGVAKTRLALIGEAIINGETVEVKSEMGFINEGEKVEIIRVAIDSIYVRKID